MDMIPPLSELSYVGPSRMTTGALLIGIAFGACLERAGLGSARKLIGQFDHSDLAVFEVMFSAIATAMLGLFWLSRLDLVDISQIYIPETFLLPQLLGGVVFGVGFALAGLCPGTSCVAAATGRIDGVMVMLGMLGGVALSGAVLPAAQRLYLATPHGALTLPRLLGVPDGPVVAAVVAVALCGFVLAPRMKRHRGLEGAR